MGMVIVESGTFTVRVDAPWAITRACSADTAPVASATPSSGAALRLRPSSIVALACPTGTPAALDTAAASSTFRATAATP